MSQSITDHAAIHIAMQSILIYLLYKLFIVYVCLSVSLFIRFCQPSLLVIPLDSIQCPHRADECKFLLMNPCLVVHRKTLLMNSFLLHQQWPAYLVHLSEMRGTVAILYDAVSRIYSKQHAVPLCSSHQNFSPGVSLKSKWRNHTVVYSFEGF